MCELHISQLSEFHNRFTGTALRPKYVTAKAVTVSPIVGVIIFIIIIVIILLLFRTAAADGSDW